jgi:hypothetical protein
MTTIHTMTATITTDYGELHDVPARYEVSWDFDFMTRKFVVKDVTFIDAKPGENHMNDLHLERWFGVNKKCIKDNEEAITTALQDAYDHDLLPDDPTMADTVPIHSPAYVARAYGTAAE